MKFIFEIDNCDNAAFSEVGPGYEVGRIMREVVESIERGSKQGNLRDVNGNKVGTYAFTEEDDDAHE